MKKQMGTIVRFGLIVAILGGSAYAAVPEGDWPCYRGDPQRSNVASAAPTPPLVEAWRFTMPQAPRPAYVDSIVRGVLRPDRDKGFQGAVEPATHDYAYGTVHAGGLTLWATTADEAVYGVDSATGRLRWRFFTQGPIRVAPQVADGRVYVGSDDGLVYCLNLATGVLLWKTRAIEDRSKAVGQNRPISAWPIRTGVVYDAGQLYLAAGMFPEFGVYLVVMDAETGEIAAREAIDYVAAGPIMLTADTIWIPGMRTSPVPFDRRTLKCKFAKKPVLLSRGASQVFQVDGLTAWGPEEAGQIYMVMEDKPLSEIAAKRADAVYGPLTVFSARAAVADENGFLLARHTELCMVPLDRFREIVARRIDDFKKGNRAPYYAVDVLKFQAKMGNPDLTIWERIEKTARWTTPYPKDFQPLCAMLAPRHAFIGGHGRVLAVDRTNGAIVWQTEVDGDVYDLTANEHRLTVSTSKGIVYAFGTTPAAASAGNREDDAKKTLTVGEDKSRWAEKILGWAGRSKGIAVVAGGDLDLVAALAAKSEFLVVLLESDPAEADRKRGLLAAAGLYGDNAIVRDCSIQAVSDFPAGFANVVVCSKDCPVPPAELQRLVQPYGGVWVVESAAADAARDPALFSDWRTLAPGWQACLKLAPPGAGSWSHAMGNAGNTMSSGEKNVPADPKRLRVQWFGAPYANDFPNRHDVPPSPLFGRGMLFLPGLPNSIRAIDAYNGTMLWQMEAPGPLRLMASHNPSSIAYSEDMDRLLVAADSVCRAVDPGTGKIVGEYKLPDPRPGMKWGFVAAKDRMLIGTSSAAGDTESFRGGSPILGVIKAWKSSPVSIGQSLFVIDMDSGKTLWKRSGTLIVHVATAIGDGLVFVAETDWPHPEAQNSEMMLMGEWMRRDERRGPRVTALSLKDGAEKWSRPIVRHHDAPNQWMIHLSCKDGILLQTRTYFRPQGKELYRGYDLEAIQAATGETIWQQWVQAEYPGEKSDLKYGKNSLSSWPILVGDRFYLRYNHRSATTGVMLGFNLRTGEKFLNNADGGIHQAGCSPGIASETGIYLRSYLHVVWDIQTQSIHPLTGATRPSCWPNTLPVGGLIVAPDGSAYCSCGFPFQMSFALAPKESK